MQSFGHLTEAYSDDGDGSGPRSGGLDALPEDPSERAAYEQSRKEEVKQRAIQKLGLKDHVADRLYYGGLQAEEFAEEEEEEVERKETKRQRLEVAQEMAVKAAPARVRPETAELFITLKHAYEPLGCVFAPGTLEVSSVLPGSAAAQAGVLPTARVVSVDETPTRAPADVVDALRTLRVTKRLEYQMVVRYEVPPLNLLGGTHQYSAPSIRAMRRSDPEWRYRGDAATYQAPQAESSDALARRLATEAAERAEKRLDKRKEAVRMPAHLADIPLASLTTVQKLTWALAKEEGERRADILRHARGRLLSLKAAAPPDAVSTIDREYIRQMAEPLGGASGDEGWVWRHVLSSAVEPFMVGLLTDLPDAGGNSRPHVAPQHKAGTFVIDPDSKDWINPTAKVQGAAPLPGQARYRGWGGAAKGGRVPPEWALAAMRTSLVFGASGLGHQVDFQRLRRTTTPSSSAAYARERSPHVR